MNRKSPSLYIRIKMKYFRMILKGTKILDANEYKQKLEFNIQEKYLKKNSKKNDFIEKILNNPFEENSSSQIYNKYKLWLIFILTSYLFVYIKHNYFQPVK